MQLNIGAILLVIAVLIAVILVLAVLVLGFIRLSARRKERFLGRSVTERAYRPVNLLGDVAPEASGLDATDDLNKTTDGNE